MSKVPTRRVFPRYNGTPERERSARLTSMMLIDPGWCDHDAVVVPT
jgi:hypothetical protein